jgi:hypothetical protein
VDHCCLAHSDPAPFKFSPFDSKQKADDFQRELIEKLPPDQPLRKHR